MPSIPSGRPLLVYTGIFLLALALRLVFFFELQGEDLFRVLLGDSRSYDDWGAGIAAGNWIGNEVFYQAPMYPYFLGIVYTLFGHSLDAVRVVQILLGSVSCVFLAMAGRRLFSPAVGWIAGVGLAIYPPALFFDVLIQKSVLDIFFLSIILALLARLMQTPQSLWRWLMLGALLGLFSLTRENALLLVALIVVWGLVSFPRQAFRKRLTRSGVLVAGLAAVLLPVAARNAAVGGEFHLTTSQLGPNLYIGNHPRASGTYEPLRPGRGDARFERKDATELAEAALGRPLSPAQVSEYWTGQSLAYMRNAPGEWLGLMGRKVLLLVNRVEITDTEAMEVYAERSILLGVMGRWLHFGVLLPVAVLGIVFSWPQRRRLWVLYLMIAGYAVSVVVFYVMARYRYPLTPLLILFAAFGITATGREVRERAWRPVAVGAGVLLVTAVLANWPLVDVARGRAATYTNLGQVVGEQGNTGGAMEYYRLALTADPESYVVHNNLANQLKRAGRDREALEHYQKSLEIRPDYAEAHNNLALVLVRQGKFAEAKEHYHTALRLNPRYPEAWANLGNLALKEGQLDTAIQCYQNALAINPGFQAVRQNLQIVQEMKTSQNGPGRP